MLIPDVFNAPRLCRAGGKFFFVRKMSLDGWGIILNWLDDVLPGERKELPKLADEESQKALQSWPGIVLQVWLALREHGVSYEDAAGIYAFNPDTSPLPDDEKDRCAWEQVHLLNCLFGRRRTIPETAGKDGDDLSKFWCEKAMSQLCGQIGVEAVAKLSIDQYEWLLTGGELDEHAAHGDIQARQDDWAANELPRILAAVEAGSLEVMP